MTKLLKGNVKEHIFVNPIKDDEIETFKGRWTVEKFQSAVQSLFAQAHTHEVNEYKGPVTTIKVTYSFAGILVLLGLVELDIIDIMLVKGPNGRKYKLIVE